MKILVAPDSFKGSMTSIEAAEAIKKGIAEVNQSIDVVMIPMADGGEGTVDAITSILKGEQLSAEVQDPLGRKIIASFGWIEETKTAVIETAAASGLPLIKTEELDPEKASTFGTGELVVRALDLGARRIIIGLGGSATVDGGTGFLQALGIRFLNVNGSEVKASGGELARINSIDSTNLDKRLEEVEFIVASDVTNPLLGSEGAVSVFGPQKGISTEKLADFEAGMKKYADKVIAHTGEDYRIIEGSGAAGGFGFALLSFLHPKIESGFKIISELSELESHLMDASFVFTGEGKVDAQSLYGKVPIGIGRIAKEYNVATVAFTGNIEGDIAKAEKEGLSLALPIVDEPMTLAHAMKQGPELLEKATIRFMRTYELLKNKGENGHE